MKNWLNKNPKLIFPLGLVIFIVIGYLYINFVLLDNPKTQVTDFNSCKEANNGVVAESYPAQCTYNGITYTEDIMPKDENSANKEGLNLDLPEAEKSQIEAWLEKNGYNQYGDKPDTVYMGGTPLFDETTGKYTKLYDYLVQKYPTKPWLEKSSSITENSNTNKEVRPFTEVKSWKNFEDPNFELQYPDFVNMDIDDKSLYLCYNKNITYQEIYQRMLDSFVIR